MKAIVPLKKHSERLPHKNILPFNGKPLYWWIFDTLHKAKTVEEIILTVDDSELGDMVKRDFPNIRVLLRPPYLCSDMVTASALIKHVLENVDGEEFLYTHATNPLLKPETIDKAFQVYRGQTVYERYPRAVMGVTRLQTRLYNGIGVAINHDLMCLTRSQDLEPVYEDNSCLYIFSRSLFESTGLRTGYNPRFFEIPKSEAFDIDTLEDFLIADAVAKA